MEMALRDFKCITCGGDVINRNGVYVCESCGNTYEAVEKISEAEVIALNRATALRERLLFDDAWEEYDLILKEYPQNEFASWGALLCEYGIIYEEDYDGSRKMNCHRLSEKPVFENVYYEKLNAEYKTEAQNIENLRLAILEKSKKIEPYDVFICYKQTEEKYGRFFPTREATWARDIYEILTHKMGLRVFFAEKALVNENTEWEPHIYAALNSAKLMFVLASSESNVSAVWVKNEWKRFHRYIKEGKEKLLRVVYDNMEAYNLPKELQGMQAINHNSINWGEAVQKAAEFLCEKPAQKSAMELQMEAILKQNEAMQAKLAELERLKREQSVKEPEITAEEANKIGDDYYYGRNGKKQDYVEAVKWFRQAAEQGNARAQCNLGWCYEAGKGVTQSWEEAVKWYQKSAEQGNARAQNNLGWCYQYGKGLTQNSTEAVKWYRKSAEQGYVDAQFNLGWCYQYGKGVTQSWEEAVKWYQKSAEKDYAKAQCNLGLCYENGQGVTKDCAEAVKWYRKAAEQGFARAQNNLGWCYEAGKGVTQSWEEAVKWYRKAAEQGDTDAQNSLGICYKNGRGVQKDYVEAVKWYRKAAEKGDMYAQKNLGACYYYGRGVTLNYTEAVKWFRKAAEQGEESAQGNLGICYEKGEGVPQSYIEAVKWYRKAAEQGFADAQFNLGLCYAKGKGVAKNRAEAEKWYRKAAEQGDQQAKENLRKLRYGF